MRYGPIEDDAGRSAGRPGRARYQASQCKPTQLRKSRKFESFSRHPFSNFVIDVALNIHWHWDVQLNELPKKILMFLPLLLLLLFLLYVLTM